MTHEDERNQATQFASSTDVGTSTQATQIWLDVFPPEVCTRIAAFVRGRVRIPLCLYSPLFRELLSLAKTSPIQRMAVLSNLQFKLDYSWFPEMTPQSDSDTAEKHSSPGDVQIESNTGPVGGSNADAAHDNTNSILVENNPDDGAVDEVSDVGSVHSDLNAGSAQNDSDSSPAQNQLGASQPDSPLEESSISPTGENGDNLHRCDLSDIPDWEDLFYEDIQVLETTVAYHPIDRKLISAPNLRHASIPFDEDLFLALRDAPKLSSLRVQLRNHFSPSLLYSHLGALNITKLCLQCWFPLHSECGFKCALEEFASLSPEQKFLRDSSNISELDISCTESHLVTATPLLRLFPRVRRLIAGTTLIDKDVSLLRDLEYINYAKAHIRFYEEVYLGPEDIGLPVQDLDFNAWRISTCIDEEQMLDLAKCPNLHSFSGVLDIGAEDHFTVLGNNIRTASLTWNYPENDFEMTSGHWYFRPSYESIISFVRRNRELEVFKLFDIQFSSQFLKTILELLGARLKTFGMKVYSEEEEPQKVLLTLMESLTKYNPSLRKLDIARWDMRIGYRLSYTPEEQLPWREPLHGSLRVLKRCFAFVDFFELDRLVYEYTGLAPAGASSDVYDSVPDGCFR